MQKSSGNGRRSNVRDGSALHLATFLLAAFAVIAAVVVVLGPSIAAAAPSSTASPSDPAGTVTTFGYGLSGNSTIAGGSDGNLWFGTDRGLGRITTAGTVTVFPGTKPGDLISGPDGNLWFSSNAGVGRATTAGAMTLFPGPLPGNYLTRGGDGNVWTSTATSINRITPAGALTTFTDPAMTAVGRVTYGADGNLWFTHPATNAIGRMSQTGVVTMFADARLSNQGGITTGADGNVWVTAFTPGSAGFPPFIPPVAGQARIVRVDPTGAMTVFDKGSAQLGLITSGPGGDLWYSYQYDATRYTMPDGGVDRMSTDGVSQPVQGHEPGRQLPTGMFFNVTATGWITGLATGADGNIWSVGGGSNSVNRIAADGGPLVSFHGTDVNRPTSIALDGKGDAWFANSGEQNYPPVDTRSGSVGKSTSGGTVTSYRSDKIARPYAVTRAADGSMWFTDNDSPAVVRVDAAGTVTAIPTGDGTFGGSITTGADGNIWIGDRYGNGIRRVTPGGVVTRFTLATTEYVRGIVGGPDGNVWFATGTTSIGRITPSGVITTFATPRTDLVPDQITSGPDGNLWFTSQGAPQVLQAIGRITTAGAFTYFSDPGISLYNQNYDNPHTITRGPDGNVWFTNTVVQGQPSAGAIARVSPSGAFTWFSSPDVPEANGIAAGPGGELWFTMRAASALGRIKATAVGSPGVPAFPAASSRPDGARVTWWPTAAAVGVTGGFVTPYRNGVALTPTAFTGSPASAIVAGLTYGETYRFTISLTNASGTGPPSPLTAPTTVGAPIAPAFVTATPTPTGATVSWWSQPVTSGVITPYLGGVAQGAIPFAGQTSAVAVAGLTGGQTYTFTVTLTNPYGTSPPSAPTNAVVAGAAPSTPVAAFPTATAGAGGVTVSWWPQPITGGTITPYLGGVAQTPVPFSGNVNSRLITGLTVGQSYRFTITLTNASGTGPPSTLTAPVTVVG